MMLQAFFCPSEPDLNHGEPCLHEEDEKGGQAAPERVDIGTQGAETLFDRLLASRNALSRKGTGAAGRLPPQWETRRVSIKDASSLVRKQRVDRQSELVDTRTPAQAQTQLVEATGVTGGRPAV